jgi:hypothetical protein
MTDETKTTIPLNVALNRLLAWCTFLGSPVEEEALKVQNKSYNISCFCSSSCSLLFTSDHIEPILNQLSQGIHSAINGTPIQQGFISHVLDDLIRLETRPVRLTEVAYEWCSVICANRRSLGDWERLLLVCLEIGFRHLDFQFELVEPVLTHTKHHRGLVDTVFESQESEVIADLLYAWASPTCTLPGFCAGHLVGLHDLVPFSPRLRLLVIRSVGVIGYKGFEGAGVERFTGLLNHLNVTVEDVDIPFQWVELLLETVQTSEGAQYLSHRNWELLVELEISLPVWRRDKIAYNQQIMMFLMESQEWSKLEYWMGVVWMVWPPGSGGITEEDLGHSMLLLCRQRPGTVRKLEQWVERWGQTHENGIPESFKRICKQAQEAAQHEAV